MTLMDESDVDAKREEAEQLLAAGQYDDAKVVAEEIHAFAVEAGDRDLREEMEYFVINAEEQQRKAETVPEETAAGEEMEAPSGPAEEEVPAAGESEVTFNLETGQASGNIMIPVSAAPTDEEIPAEPAPSKKGKKGRGAAKPTKEKAPEVGEGEIPWGQGIFREKYQWTKDGSEFSLKKA